MMKPLINFRPLLYLAISVCFGIASSYLLLEVSILLASIFSGVFILGGILTFFIFKRKENRLISIIVLILSFLIFIVGFSVTFIKLHDYEKANLNNHVYEVKGKIEKINTYDKYQTAICYSNTLIGVNGEKTDYKIRLFIYGYKDLQVGDVIYFTATLQDNGAYYNSRFSAEQISDKIKYTAEVYAEDIVRMENQKSVFQKMNAFISNSLKDGLSGEEYAVAYALLTGDSSFIDGEVLKNFRNAGIAHVFAVSGLHIGVLAVAVSFIFSKLKLNKKISAFATVFICLFYSGVCGFSSSSIRATIMCAVSLFASISGRKYDGVSSVCFAGILILLVNPIQLFCVGFQLSFGVVLGIFVLSPVITKLFKFLPNKISSALGVTLSAQIVSVPICLSAFSEVSLVSTIFNILMIPIISPLFVVLLFATVMGGIFGISFVLLFPIKYLLIALIAVINFFDYDIFMIGGITLGAFTVCYYVFFIIWSGFVNLKKTLKLVLCVSLALIFTVGVVVKNLNEYRAVKCYAVGSSDLSAVIIKSNAESALIISVAELDFSTRKLETLKNQAKLESVDKIILSSYISPEKSQEYFSLIRRVMCASQLYYFGEENKDIERVVERSFDGVDAINYLDYGEISFANAIITSDCDGKIIIVNANGKQHAIISKIGGYDECVYERISNCATVIAYDYQDYLLSLSEEQTKISFLAHGDFKNAEQSGILKIKLK